MERIKLGRTDLDVSPVCFGCWQMSGTFWGAVDEEKLIAALHHAVELGVNFIDTADAYGNGLSETIVAKAIADLKRDDLVIATKVYHHWFVENDEKSVGDLSYDYIIWECEQSLKRLNIDCIDLYQAHTYDVFTPLEETARAFDKLKQQGKIRFYGTSNFTADQLRAAVRFGDFDTVQPMYNLLHREIESDVLPVCEEHNLGVLAYSPLQNGLLTGKFKGTEKFDDFRDGRTGFVGDDFKRNVERVDACKPIAERLGKTMPQLALRFVMDHPAVHCAIAGIKTVGQIEDCAGAMGWTLTREDYYLLRQSFDSR